MVNANQVEKDFIEFISLKRNRPLNEIEDIYLKTKKIDRFWGSKYKDLCETIYDLNRILYDNKDEKDLIKTYKFHSLINLFRMISYSYPESTRTEYFKGLIRTIVKQEYKKSICFLKMKILDRNKKYLQLRNYPAIAKFLIDQISGAPFVVDYGCGLGYCSFEIGKLRKDSKIYLVDIDHLILKFAEFRFKKHELNAEIIPVTSDNLYPKLPKHNICLAMEIMEHLVNPLIAYQNIINSLEKDGILYCNFEDHRPEMFHVSPNLEKLRILVPKDFQKINRWYYRRK